MTGPAVQTPPPPPVLEAVRRAMDEAQSVSETFLAPPCGFVRLGDGARALVAGPGGHPAGEWIVVTARRPPAAGRQAHLHERCRTVAQRFMLALACEGVDGVWAETDLDARAFRSAGTDIGTSEPVGLVWCRPE